MKILALVLLLTLTYVYAGNDPQVLTPHNSDDILDHLQGNNYNIYLLFFSASGPYEEIAIRNNKDVESGLNKILLDNPEIFYATIPHTNPNFNKLIQTTGIHAAPSVFLIVHGKGVWIYEGTSDLIVEKVRDFLPKFKEASAKHVDPYEAK